MSDYYDAIPMMDKCDPHYSSNAPKSIGYDGNDKGHANRERDDQKNWSDQQILTTGLVDREKL